MLRDNRTNSEDAVRSGDNLTSDVLKFLEQKPPTGHPSTVRDTGPHIEAPQYHTDYASAMVGVAAGGIVMFEAGRQAFCGIKRLMGRNNDDNG